MIDIIEMQSKLEKIISESKLDTLFKPGRVKTRTDKLPHFVSIRLKLHNPYTFLEFALIEKKSGLKFSIHHLKTIHPELKKELLALGGAADNSNTIIDFPCGEDENGIVQTASRIFALLMTSAVISACEAQDYKPLKIIQAAKTAQ